jgi:hypothetical protein
MFDDDELDEDRPEEAEGERDDEPPPERRRDGRFDYTNEDGIEVPKDQVF